MYKSTTKRPWRENPLWYWSPKDSMLFTATKPTLTMYERQVMTSAVIRAVAEYCEEHIQGHPLSVPDSPAYRLRIENGLYNGIDSCNALHLHDAAKEMQQTLYELPTKTLTQQEAIIKARESMKRMTIHALGSTLHKNMSSSMMEQFKYLSGIIS